MFEDVHPWMIPLAFFYLIIIPIGVFGNIIMVVCFFVNPRLRSPFHILLTFTCLADAFHICGQIVFVFQLLNQTTLTQSTCYFLNILPVIGCSISGPLLLQIGLDRLLAVSFPLKFRELQLRKVRYTAVHLLFPVAYTSSILFLGFIERNDENVKCAIPPALAGVSLKFLLISSNGVFFCILVTYMMTAILLKNNDASSRFRAAFKSIAVTVAMTLFGWMFGATVNTFSFYVTDDPEMRKVIQMYSGVTVNIAISSNLFVFYLINPEYRLTVNMLFACSCRRLSNQVDSASEKHQLQVASKSQDR